jgi:hypothetical protein
MKTSRFLLGASIVLAMAFTFSCGYALHKNHPLPENLRKAYDETVDVPGVSAEDLFKKIRLYLIGNNFLKDHFRDSYTSVTNHGDGKTASTRTYTKTANWASKVEGVFDEKNNRIIFIPEEELSNPITGTRKKKVTVIAVLISPGQYNVIATLDSIHSSGINIEKDFKEFLPEIETYWLSFTTKMKQAITEQVTDEEFEKMIELSKTNVSGIRSDVKVHLKAAIARPNNTVALLNLGNSLGNKESDHLNVPGPKEPIIYHFATSSFNMASYVLGLIPEKDSQVNESLQHWQNSSARATEAWGGR